MTACPRCGHPALAGARFCSACGTPLVAPPDPARFGSPGAYTPAHLAERIRGSREALAGERKQVTVLFADMQGSMELLADRDPEEAGRILDQVLEQMMEAVHRYEGTVNQVMGDGIMALFGAPLAHEDHAVRAAYAALRMQERIGAFGDRMQRAAGVPLQIRVGINSGEVMVRAIENDLSMSYTAVGPTVHLAARMEQMAKPGSILATADTVALGGGRVVTRSLGLIPVRGLHAPVEVHEVTGAATAPSRADAAAARGLSPFVGRDTERAALLAALDAAAGGGGPVVAMVGEAGVGKSRLVREFARLAREQGALVLETATVSYGRAVGHRAGIELNRRFFQIERGDNEAVAREKIAAGMRAVDRGLEDGVAAVQWLLGVPPAASPFLALDPGARRRRAVEVLVRLVDGLCARQPVVLVFEDLQWLDSEGAEALDYMATHMPRRALLLVTYRPEHDDRWHRVPGYARLRLEPLAPPAAQALLASLLGPAEDTGPIGRLVAERGRGNPLFLEECVRSLADTGVLAGSRGAYRMIRPAATLEVPASVRAVLAARIDRLPAEQKRLLQAASVVGEDVPVPLLEAIVDLPVERVRAALDELRGAELLAEASLFPDPVYAFRHALAHDVAYASLLHEGRRALHARIVETIERLYAGRLDDQIERLAHHAFTGEQWARAVHYCREAGLRALARLSCPEAVERLERALQALGHLPDTEESRRLAVDLRFNLGAALVPLGAHARALGVLREAEALAGTLGDERRLARALSYQSNMHWEMGDAEAASEAGRRALAIAERAEDLALQVVGNFSLAGATRSLGDYPRAAELLRRNVALLEGDLRYETFGLAGLASVMSRSHLAWSLAELGEFDEAIARAEEGIRLAEGAGHVYSLAYACLGLGGTLLRRGRLGAAQGVLERGLALCEEVPGLFPPFAGDLALVRALGGRAAEAVELAAQGVARAERMGRLGRLSLIATHLGEVQLLAGRLDEAAEQGRRALSLARTQNERGNQVYALRLLGLVASETPPADRDAVARHESAARYFDEALALAEGLGMRPLVARCRLGLGRLARRAGDTGTAARHLDAATALLHELGMTYWLERVDLDPAGRAPSLGPPGAAAR
ncbi:MAG TPA: AAA family ATPase [Pseudomonadales bacterium]|nr:AAA family ATPase [Pseudomonadales bacterium]